MQSVIVAWQVYQITKSPFALGLIGLTEAVPFIGIALFAGHVADIADRRKIILISNFIFILCSTTLFLFNFPCSHIFHTTPYTLLATTGVLPIYILIFITGLARGFIYPPQMGLMAQIVPKELYPNSSTWNSLLFHLATIMGPAFGGLIYGFINVNAAYFTVMVFGTASLILFFMVKKQPIPVKQQKETLIKSLSTGVKFVFNNQILLGAMSLDMFAVLFGGAVAMLPVFANEILKVGPQGLGFLRAAPAAGAICMSFYLAYHPPVKNTGRKLLSAVTGFGICIILFAISKSFYLSLLLLVLSGVCDNVSVVVRQTIMQLFTPDEMRGRVASVNSIFIGSSNEIGAFESGLAAKLLTLIPLVIFGGCMTILIAGTAAKIAPKLRGLSIISAPPA